MKTICNDHEMINEIMEQMMQNDQAMQMMGGRMMMCPMHGGMKISDNIEGGKEHMMHYNH